jgi:hypothetical protein
MRVLSIPKIPAFLKLPAVFLGNTDSFPKSLRSEYRSFSIRATRSKKLTDRLQERVLSPGTIVRAAAELPRKTQSGRTPSKRKFAETLRPDNGLRLKYIRFTFLPALRPPLGPMSRGDARVSLGFSRAGIPRGCAFIPDIGFVRRGRPRKRIKHSIGRVSRWG